MSKDKHLLPYGTWPSPITPELTGGLPAFSEPAWTSQGHLLWHESQGERSPLMILERDAQRPREVKQDLSIGGGVLYGGGSFTVRGDQAVAVEKKSSRLLGVRFTGEIISELTELPGRAASPSLSPGKESLLFVHSYQGEDCLQVLVGGSPPAVLHAEADFYNYPRWHPDGKQLAWMNWSHPDMPWDSSQISLAQLVWSPDGFPRISETRVIAGGSGISALQPEFSPNGRHLAYVSDRTGWWQIYLLDLRSGHRQQLTTAQAEHGLPAWLQEMRTYSFNSEGNRLYFLRNQDAHGSLWLYDLKEREERQIELDGKYTWLEDIAVSPRDDTIALIASSPRIPKQLITVDQSGRTRVIRSGAPDDFPASYFSVPEPVTWPAENGVQIRGLFYSPHHPEYTGQGAPPLLVFAHSGPTRQRWAEFRPRVQYFTSRGYAVLEVNYRGSTGYGREYREALYGEWGLIDVKDCVSGARHLVDQGLVDPHKLALMGSSAGGLTVLQTLINHPGLFQAGVSLYGVVDHLTLREITSKFERYYSDRLIGPYPEKAERYRERSPIHAANRIRDPVAVFQGGQDPVVPQTQAETLVGALQEHDIPHLYVLYPEEGHGFKKSSTVADFFRRTEAFLARHLKLSD